MCPVHIIYTLSQHAAITKPCSYVKAPTLQIPPDNKSPSKELSKTLGLLPASLPFSSAAATQELPALRPPPNPGSDSEKLRGGPLQPLQARRVPPAGGDAPTRNRSRAGHRAPGGPNERARASIYLKALFITINIITFKNGFCAFFSFLHLRPELTKVDAAFFFFCGMYRHHLQKVHCIKLKINKYIYI